MNFVPHLSFTVKSDARLLVIQTPIKVSLPAATKEEALDKKLPLKEYTGIWDTGATHSVITKKIVDELGLKPTGVVEVSHAQGKTITNTYLVNIVLPNNVIVPIMKVSEGKLSNTDMLIGMDVITQGDFSITNKMGKTTMSFRLPSCKEIDYVPESTQYNHAMQNGNKKLRGQMQAKYN